MSGRPTIRPHLWFDTEARQAAEFYCSVFPGSAMEHLGVVRDTPSGDCEVAYFRLAGQPFMAISAGPAFSITPAISFILNFDPGRDPQAQASLDATWARLVEGGTVLMPLDEYPFSPRYGWLQDRFGLSWQLILSDPDGSPRPFITPSLLFTGAVCGKAEEAAALYREVFDDSELGLVARYPDGMAPDREGTVMYMDFRLGDTWFAAMDSAHAHAFGFNEAVAFVIECADQAEIDRYWSRLSAVPEAEACGWCKDRYGVSWLVVPAVMLELMRSDDPARVARVMSAMLQMKKLDVAGIVRAAGD